MTKIRIKRIYEPSEPDDGYRVLVDRVWPRGVRKAAAQLDLWCKDVAPSTALRKWFAHDSAKWPEFQHRYRQELKDRKDTLHSLLQKADKKPLTLLYGARDEKHNQAVVLKAVLEKLAP